MRLIMMGTGPFAVPTLEELQGSHHKVAALATAPLRTHRGKEVPPASSIRSRFAAPGRMPDGRYTQARSRRRRVPGSGRTTPRGLSMASSVRRNSCSSGLPATGWPGGWRSAWP